ncbi:MAG: hypothetical protein IPM46_14160 [Flavobacteriales bacterium]|nr:hypothetical protein [Flavobacteriales bacterium]
MAFDAIRGEAGTRVVREPGGVELVVVAVDAIVAHAGERQRIVSDVAVHAAEVAVRADERESVLLMQLRDIIHQPGPRCVAPGAVITDGHRMNIGVAGDAIRWHRCIEHQGTMTGPAIHLRMHTHQRERRGIMVEDQGIAHCHPAIRNVAGRAVDLEGSTMRRLTYRPSGE